MMAAICLTALLPLNASAAVLDDVRNTGVFKIGYRADAAPYSSVDPRGAISGYSIGLCRRIAEAVRKHLNLKNLTIDLIAVSGATRFDALTKGHIHILCGATTETLTRHKIIDFTPPTFITGAGFLTRTGGASDPRDLAFRNFADTALSRIYQSPEILTIFRTAFGPGAAPTELLKSLYIISSLPE